MLSIANKQIAVSFLVFGLSYGIALAGGMPQGAVHKVGMEGWLFNPEELTIQVGDSVTWLNDDDVDHNIAFYEVRPANAPTEKKPQGVDVGKKYSLVFNQAGVFKYVCRIHKRQDMKGVVIVE